MSRAKVKHAEKSQAGEFCGVCVNNGGGGVKKLAANYCEVQRLMQQTGDMSRSENSIPLQINEKWYNRPSTIVHILITVFGTSAWIGVNGIFIQLPLLVISSPDSWGLASKLVVAVQAANLAPILYSFSRKTSFKISESKCIVGLLTAGTIVMALLAFLYDKTSVIAGVEHSTALIALTFFTAAVSCTSSVLFMPYLRNFKEMYLVSYFIGEGLSGVVPSVVALIQGIDESPKCDNKTSNSTQLSDLNHPRFSSRYYFLFLCVSLFLSLVAFLFLESLSYIKSEKALSGSSDNNSSSNEAEIDYCQNRQVSVLREGSIFENEDTDKNACMDDYKKTDIQKSSNICYTQSSNRLTLKTVYLYLLLSIICLLANGFLPALQPYSCLSYGNMAYHLSATFSQIANPTACLLALWFLPHSIQLINGLSVIIFVTSSYVVYLALVSPNAPLQNSDFGRTLVILSWILIVGLISYVKLIITAVFRRKSEKKLFYVGIAMQAGSACGAIFSFVLINYTKLLKEYEPCSDSNK